MYIAIGPTTEEYEHKQHHVSIVHASDELTIDEVMDLFKGALQAYGYVFKEDMDD